MPQVEAIKQRYEMLVGRINQRQLREFAGVEAKVFGRGGVRAVARATGLAINTVRRGLADLASPPVADASVRMRKAGGGRKKLREKDGKLVEALEGLVEPFVRGDPATSKWNKIEHRLFCHITQNWRGKALVSHEVIIQLIAATSTNTGLKVRAEADPSHYQTKLKPSADQMNSIKLSRADFHGEWNYTIKP